MTAFAISRPTRGLDGARAMVGAVILGLLAAGVTIGVTHVGTLKATAGIIVALGVVWFGTTRNPQLALALIMLYLGLLDGYLKLATGSGAITFVRDALLFALAIGLLIRMSVRRMPLVAPPLAGWLVVFIVIVFAQLLNPNDGTLLHSFAGIRQNLEFIPLFWLTFLFVRTKRALRVFVALFAVIAVANGAVTYVQSKESPAQLASWGPGYAARVNGTGAFALGGRTYYTASGQEFTRPFGLMSDAGTGGLVCAYALACILVLATTPGRRRYLVPGLIAGVVAVAGMITAQGRSVIIGGVVVMAAYALMVGSSRFRGRFIPFLIAIGVAGVVYLGVTEFLVSRSSRDTTISASQIVQTTGQSRGLALTQIPYNLAHYPFGSGLGSGGPAVTEPGAPMTVQVGVNAETEISLATLDSGVPGMLAIVGFTLVLIAVGLARVPREPDRETRALLSALVAPLPAVFVLYWVSPLLATTPTGPYLFAIGGIISYWLIERPRELRATQPAAAPLGGGPVQGQALVAG
jgi:hypothetical protein